MPRVISVETLSLREVEAFISVAKWKKVKPNPALIARRNDLLMQQEEQNYQSILERYKKIWPEQQ